MNNGNLAKIVTKILFLITHEHSKALEMQRLQYVILAMH